MSKILLCALGVSLVLPAAAQTIRGQWIVDDVFPLAAGQKEAEKLQLTLNRSSGRGHWMNTDSVLVGDLRGLSRAQLGAAVNTPVKFEIVRAAGTLACEGFFREGQGAGSFEFRPDAGFPGEMRSLGFDNLSNERVFAMAMHDITPRFVRELRAAGVDGFSTEQLIALRIHRVTPAFVQELRSLGYVIPQANQLVAMRIHGANPEFIREVAAAGYRDLPVDQLIAMRIHGVSPEYIRRLQGRGMKLSVDKMVQMRIHGID